MIFEDTTRSTCSPDSVDGPKRSASPDGPMPDLFGRPLVPARRSASQADVRRARVAKVRVLCGALDELASQYARTASTLGLPMPDTYGRKPGGLSRSADLTRSLASRLRARLGVSGSLEYALRWKSWDLLLGLRIYALRASGRRKSGSDCGSLHGWATPTAADAIKGDYTQDGRAGPKRPSTKGLLAGWPTPIVPSGGRSIDHAEFRGGTAYYKGKKVQVDLQAVARLAGWPTRRARDHHTESTSNRDAELKFSPSLARLLAGWATPRASDGTKNIRTRAGALNEAERKGAGNDLGVTSALSPAPMGRRGALAPEFSRWLMGFPSEWLASAPHRREWLRWQVLMAPVSWRRKLTALGLSEPSEMPSSRKSRPRS